MKFPLTTKELVQTIAGKLNLSIYLYIYLKGYHVIRATVQFKALELISSG